MIKIKDDKLKYILAVLFISTLANYSLNAAPRQLYSFQDLQALVDSNGYIEFFDHALDIRPSKRNEKWQKMCFQMAQLYMKSSLKKSLNKKKIEKILEVLAYPHFDQDEIFISKREKFLAKLIKHFASNHTLEEVKELSLRISDNFKTTKYYGYFVTESLFKHYKMKELEAHSSFFYQLLTPLLKSQYSEFYCHKHPTRTVLKRLILNNGKKVKVHKDCLNKLYSSIEEELYNPNSMIRVRAYTYLKQHKKLSEDEHATYHVLNLINGRKVSDNEWNTVLSSLDVFKNNSQLRKSTMDVIEKYDPYPDNFLKTYKNKRLAALSRMLARSFPEYLDRYTHSCLSFLNGKKTYPKGNPTPNCHRYMEISKQSKSSPNEVLQQYDHIMNSWKTR